MKNTYKFVILLLFAGAIASCEKEEDPIKHPSEMDIVDPEFRNSLISQFDTNVDFKLSLNEILAVKEIISSNPKIRSFEGIEIFKNLEEFAVGDGSAKSINFTKNLKIKQIYISHTYPSETTIYLLKSQKETCEVYDGSGNTTVKYL